MNINAFKQSRYMTKMDVERPLVCTISEVKSENVAPDGQAPENKAVIYFEEDCKPLVQGSQGLAKIAKFLGSEDTDDWTGKKVTVYIDDNIMYGGKEVGGIRCRAPKGAKTVDLDDE